MQSLILYSSFILHKNATVWYIVVRHLLSQVVYSQKQSVFLAHPVYKKLKATAKSAKPVYKYYSNLACNVPFRIRKYASQAHTV